ncbi:hypothetical protein T492DRAFT_912698, partial [Pavlovales sp. CCMP2436]
GHLPAQAHGSRARGGAGRARARAGLARLWQLARGVRLRLLRFGFSALSPVGVSEAVARCAAAAGYRRAYSSRSSSSSSS